MYTYIYTYINITEYLRKIKPYPIALIDEKKNSTSQEIQLDILVNLIHLTESDKITFFCKIKKHCESSI